MIWYTCAKLRTSSMLTWSAGAALLVAFAGVGSLAAGAASGAACACNRDVASNRASRQERGKRMGQNSTRSDVTTSLRLLGAVEIHGKSIRRSGGRSVDAFLPLPFGER